MCNVGCNLEFRPPNNYYGSRYTHKAPAPPPKRRPTFLLTSFKIGWRSLTREGEYMRLGVAADCEEEVERGTLVQVSEDPYLVTSDI